jgi:hypothetical protein
VVRTGEGGGEDGFEGSAAAPLVSTPPPLSLVRPSRPGDVTPVLAEQSEGGGESIALRPEIEILRGHAESHTCDFAAREEQVALRHQRENDGVPLLVTLCKQFILENEAALPVPPGDWLLDHVLDSLYASKGRGREVARSFVAEVALQAAVPDGAGGPNADEECDGRVSVSTVHRAKGLEWPVVIVPNFNEGLMPCVFQEDQGDRATRHVQGCAARQGGGACCDKGCAQFFRQNDSHGRGTPEERHDDEERRLAHVAATRAKDRLIFVQVQRKLKDNRWVDVEPSQYEPLLHKLPADVLTSVQL